MTRRVSHRLLELSGSVTLAVSTRARELRAEGKDIISFAAGEPDFPTPEHILAAASRAVHDPANHHYTANTGLAPLREAIADNTLRYSGVPTDPSQVLVTNGAKQAIYNTCAALVDPGDEVLVPAPYWVTYPASIALAGGVIVPIETSADSAFKITVADLERHATERTKALILVSPSNPTGTVYSAEELAAIGEWARRTGTWVIADEIYQRLCYDAPVAPSIGASAPDLETLVMVNGVAKSYAMTGWRVGWVVAPSDIVDAAARLHSHATGNVANVSQQAALAALTGPQDTVEEMRQAFDRRRKLMHAGVSALPGVVCHEPEGAFYVFPDVRGLLGDRWATTQDLALDILERAGVGCVAGESFGTPGYLRFSYALGEDDIERGVARVAALIESV
ncbi:MAG: pyridoxal phosphate-dependent aminotransferase [Actinobacteria bacterium]|nr:pyridoxal phosphate-dependent aminotransferase [Actinomycetota bacterium]MCI0679163.1 pyridoxal phosphate-dependent aminotransferase [Actinomycetota bacterium]